MISWRDAVVWCNAYSEATGKTPVYKHGGAVLRTSADSSADSAVPDPSANGYRLPTEAQWEYAARGGVPSNGAPWTNKYAGTNEDNALGNYAWYLSNAGKVTHPVGGKTANTAGLRDMSGNVWEWCWDKYSGGTERVLRGGSCDSDATGCAVASRFQSYPDSWYYIYGFRVACP
jgi:formylglycine-generating enzyme required for sulfatase activity